MNRLNNVAPENVFVFLTVALVLVVLDGCALNKWSKVESASEFRFEDYEKVDALGKEHEAAALAGLYRFFPIGSDTEALKTFLENMEYTAKLKHPKGHVIKLSGTCYQSKTQSNAYWCDYEHQSSRITIASIRWFIKVRYNEESNKINKIEIGYGMTTP